MRVTIEFDKRNLRLLQAFLYHSYDNFHSGIYCTERTKQEVRAELKQLDRIKAAFKPVMEGSL